MYRAILLDVMGTLVTEPFFEVVPRALGLSLEEIFAHKHPTAWVDFELGLIDEAELERRFFLDGRKYPHAAMRAAMIDHYDYIDGIEPLLVDLRAAGRDLHLLSNYPLWYQHIESKLGLSRYAPWTFVSCHTGVRKPDPEAYLGAARALALPPEACLFVDDRGVNCKAAAAVGMGAIRFESADQLRRELVARGVLSSPS
jgi:HAD superfamily hydrolase (TIGR01509 family)